MWPNSSKATMVLIVPPRGESFAVNVNHDTVTLRDLKVAIEQHHGTPVLDQHLFLSHSLDGDNDSDLISNLGIVPSSTLTLHVGATTIVGSSDDKIGSTSSSSVVKEEEELDNVKTAAKEGKEESDKKGAKEEEDVRFIMYLSDEDEYVGCHPVENLIHTDPYLRRIMKRPCAEMEELKQARLKKDLEEIAIQMDRYLEEEEEKDMEKINKSREEEEEELDKVKTAAKEWKEESDNKGAKEEEDVRFIMYLSDEDEYVGCHPVENLIHTDPYLRRIMKRPCAEMEELKQAMLKKDLEEMAIQMDRYLEEEEELEKDMEKINKKARKEKIAKEGKDESEYFKN